MIPVTTLVGRNMLATSRSGGSICSFFCDTCSLGSIVVVFVVLAIIVPLGILLPQSERGPPYPGLIKPASNPGFSARLLVVASLTNTLIGSEASGLEAHRHPKVDSPFFQRPQG